MTATNTHEPFLDNCEAGLAQDQGDPGAAAADTLGFPTKAKFPTTTPPVQLPPAIPKSPIPSSQGALASPRRCHQKRIREN